MKLYFNLLLDLATYIKSDTENDYFWLSIKNTLYKIES